MIIFSATYTNMADIHFAPQNNLLLGTLYRLILYSPQHFTQHILLLPGTQFAPQNTLLPRSLCFLANFAFWTNLLLGTMLHGVNCSREQSVHRYKVLKSKVFWGVKCIEKESELGCKVYHATYTEIPYRASTGPEQGFPCVVFPLREKPVVSSWDPCSENRFFPVGNTTQRKPCFHYKDGFAV